jgi:uncharacterized RDD family membrane protein YckC
MACPRCGDVCRCRPTRGRNDQPGLRARFEVDDPPSPQPSSSVLVDPEQYDASEERFSASLESAGVLPRFVPDGPALSGTTDAPARARAAPDKQEHAQRSSQPQSEAILKADAAQDAAECPDEEAAAVGPDAVVQHLRSPDAKTDSAPSIDNPNAWKEELAARLSSYRARRKPRPPKYPSLSLNFEPNYPAAPVARNAHVGSALPSDEADYAPPRRAEATHSADEVSRSSLPPGGRVIKFPKLFNELETSADELAEPICEHPRILDAPEVDLPAPALGGIVMDAAQDHIEQGLSNFEVPLQSCSIVRRGFAAALDLVIVGSAGLMFGSIFFKLTKEVPPMPQLLVSTALVCAILWVGYQYLLLTYAGATPGLRAAKLRLRDFDGSPVVRSRRRWRVLASVLSGVSLGLGFVWCFLDEDALCWHDRITRTHLSALD